MHALASAQPACPPPLQGVAVLGIALIAMGEEIGAEMALRTFGHLVSDGTDVGRGGGFTAEGGMDLTGSSRCGAGEDRECHPSAWHCLLVFPGCPLPAHIPSQHCRELC